MAKALLPRQRCNLRGHIEAAHAEGFEAVFRAFGDEQRRHLAFGDVNFAVMHGDTGRHGEIGIFDDRRQAGTVAVNFEQADFAPVGDNTRFADEHFAGRGQGDAVRVVNAARQAENFGFAGGLFVGGEAQAQQLAAVQFADVERARIGFKRKVIQRLLDGGLFPYTRRYLSTLNNHFNTIGLCGMNECCLNFLGVDLVHPRGKAFAEEVLVHMRNRLADYQEKTGELFNLEATPAESTSYRLARHDKQQYPDIITSGDKDPYYTNSTQLPVDYTSDVFEAMDHQESLQTKYTGGTVFHIFMGEAVKDWRSSRDLVRAVTKNYRVPYITVSPIYSVCKIHGYLNGEVFECPRCKAEKERELRSKLRKLEEERQIVLNQ